MRNILTVWKGFKNGALMASEMLTVNYKETFAKHNSLAVALLEWTAIIILYWCLIWQCH